MRILDPVTNFAEVTVVGSYSSSDTAITLQTGDGGLLPDTTDGAFNLIWYNATDYTGPAADPQREIVRVVTRTTDVLTVLRGQEGISATAKSIAGKTYKMALTLTKRTIDQADAKLVEADELLTAIGPNGFPAQAGNVGKVMGTDGTNLVWQVDAGGVDTVTNVGGGTGTIGKDVVGNVLNLKTLLAGTNMTIVNDANTITLNATGGGGGTPGESDSFTTLATDPVSPADGDVWYNSTDNKFRFYQNGAVVELGSGGGGSTTTQEDIVPFAGTTITLATTVTSTVYLFKNGVLQTVAGGDYTIAGQVITLGVASIITDRFTALVGALPGGGTVDPGSANTFTGTNTFNGAVTNNSTVTNSATSTTTYADSSTISNQATESFGAGYEATYAASSSTTFADESAISNQADETFGSGYEGTHASGSTVTHASGSTDTYSDESIIFNQADETFGAGYEGTTVSGASMIYGAGAILRTTDAPTNSLDVANKGYVDTAVASAGGGSPVSSSALVPLDFTNLLAAPSATPGFGIYNTNATAAFDSTNNRFIFGEVSSIGAYIPASASVANNTYSPGGTYGRVSNAFVSTGATSYVIYVALSSAPQKATIFSKNIATAATVSQVDIATLTQSVAAGTTGYQAGMIGYIGGKIYFYNMTQSGDYRSYSADFNVSTGVITNVTLLATSAFAQSNIAPFTGGVFGPNLGVVSAPIGYIPVAVNTTSSFNLFNITTGVRSSLAISSSPKISLKGTHVGGATAPVATNMHLNITDMSTYVGGYPSSENTSGSLFEGVSLARVDWNDITII